jgi:GT2 family glycosyltransferase
MVRGEIEPVTVIRGDGDWWWAGSLQQGYEWLKTHEATWRDVALIINDDTEFASDFLEKGLAILRQHERTLLLAQCFDRDTGQRIDTGRQVNWRRLSFDQAVTLDQINCFTTRGLFLRVADFLNTGGFHPRILPHYLSDYEFTIRAHRKGLKLLSDPSLVICVDNNATGYHEVKNMTFGTYLKNFSRKSAANPFTWTAFITLACPWPWKLIHLIRVWENSARTLISSLARSIIKSGMTSK